MKYTSSHRVDVHGTEHVIFSSLLTSSDRVLHNQRVFFVESLFRSNNFTLETVDALLGAYATHTVAMDG